MLKAYLAQIRMNLRLTYRDRTVVFFNYLFPLIFFFMFAQMLHAEQGGAIMQVVTMVLSIGILGTGFFGAGMRAVQDREANILRRFKVAPISRGADPGGVLGHRRREFSSFGDSACCCWRMSCTACRVPSAGSLCWCSFHWACWRSAAWGCMIASVVNSIAGEPDSDPDSVFSHAVPERRDHPDQRAARLAAEASRNSFRRRIVVNGMQAILGQQRIASWRMLTASRRLMLTTVARDFSRGEAVPLGKRRKDRGVGKAVAAGGAGSVSAFWACISRAIAQSIVQAQDAHAADSCKAGRMLIRGARIFWATGGDRIGRGAGQERQDRAGLYGRCARCQGPARGAMEAAGKTLLPGTDRRACAPGFARRIFGFSRRIQSRARPCRASWRLIFTAASLR